MKQKLTTKGHITAFNNEQGPYRRVSYKMPRNDKGKTRKLEYLNLLFKRSFFALN